MLKHVKRSELTEILSIFVECYEAATRFSVEVSNRFAALAELPDNVEEAWGMFSSTVRSSAEQVIGYKRPSRKPWLSGEALGLIKQKAEARLQGDKSSRNRLQREFISIAKRDRETFYNGLADDAERAMAQNELRPAFRAIRILSGQSQDTRSTHLHDSQGHPCKSDEAILSRWSEHYKLALNHPPAVASPELDAMSSSTVPDTDIPVDAPTCEEVRRAILKLKNGRAPGADGLPPELLKCAVDSVVEPLLKIFHLVWKTGIVPADWRDAIIVSLYKGPRWSEIADFEPILVRSA